jgi:hypothetical protein
MFLSIKMKETELKAGDAWFCYDDVFSFIKELEELSKDE